MYGVTGFTKRDCADHVTAIMKAHRLKDIRRVLIVPSWTRNKLIELVGYREVALYVCPTFFHSEFADEYLKRFGQRRFELLTIPSSKCNHLQ